MKLKLVSLVLMALITSVIRAQEKTSQSEATVIEMVLWKPSEGTSVAAAQEASRSLNDFVRQQPGFISRTTAKAGDGQFLDIVYWTDLNAAKQASEKAMKNENVLKVFSTMDESTMIFKHFNIWNTIP